MDLFNEEYLLKEKKNKGTGGFVPSVKIIPYLFDKYEIGVVVTPSNKFVGIKDIKIEKDFLSHEQRMKTMDYYDDSDYYQK